MIINIIYNKENNILNFDINGKIYKKEDFDLKKIDYEEFINNIKQKYISSITFNKNIFYDLKLLLFDAKIMYDLYIHYNKFDEQKYNEFNDKINNFINSYNFNVIKKELIKLKIFLIYTYYDHFYNFKN